MTRGKKHFFPLKNKSETKKEKDKDLVKKFITKNKKNQSLEFKY